MITAVIGMAEHELAQRQVPGPLEHLGVDLETVAEEDEHERGDREVAHEARPRIDLQDVQPVVAEQEPDEHEDRGQRQERAPREARQQRAADEQRAEHGRRRLERGHAGTVPHAKRRGGIDEKCASPCWASLLPGRTPDGACSGYLVEEHGACLLLDCGNGVFSKLRRFCDYVDVDAVVISHLHADHILDLVPFASALTYAPRQQPVPVDRWPGTDNPARPRAATCPRAAATRCAAICGGGGMPEEHVENAFELHEYAPEDVVEVGTHARALPSRAALPAHLRRRRLARPTAAGASPTAPTARPTRSSCASPTAPTCCMIEATLPRPEREGPRGHLTPSEAGEHGSKARVRRLVLTHISDELDADWAQREAEKAFGGPVDVAVEGAVFTCRTASRKPSARRGARVGLGDAR